MMKINLSVLAVPVVPVAKNGQREPANSPETIANQGLQPAVPVVPVVPVTNGKACTDTEPKHVSNYTAAIVTALATGQPSPAPALPADLVERVDLICQLERWPDTDREELLGMLRRQIERDGVPARELVAMLDAHLARWHGHDDTHNAEAFEERAAIMEHDGGLPRAEAEQLAGQVNDCMACRHWQGVQTYADLRFKALSAAGVDIKPKSMIMGTCARRNRPWRDSNIPADPAYFRWHFIGQCGWEGKA